MSTDVPLTCTLCRHLTDDGCSLHGLDLENPAYSVCGQCLLPAEEADTMPRRFPGLTELSPDWIYAMDPAGELTPLVQVARRRRSRPPTGRLVPLPELPEAGPNEGGVNARERFEGALIGLALGEALGLPAEGRSPQDVELMYGGRLTNLVARLGRRHTWPVGQIAKDTQLVQVLGASLLAKGGALDLDDLSERLVRWLPSALKPGKSTVQAVTALGEGHHWSVSGVDSNGAGGSTRLVPLALLRRGHYGLLRQEAVMQCRVTHTGSKAVAGAVLFATAVAALVDTPAGRLDPKALLALLEQAIRGIDLEASTRLNEVTRALDRGTPAEELVATFKTGGYVLECLPSALGCFLNHPDEPERALLAAINGGFDACATGALTGALAGAYGGLRRLPERWVEQLGCREPLLQLAHALHALSATSGPSPAA